MLFDGLMRQSEINHMLDELFGHLEGDSLDEAEGVVLKLSEEEERNNDYHAMLLTA